MEKILCGQSLLITHYSPLSKTEEEEEEEERDGGVWELVTTLRWQDFKASLLTITNIYPTQTATGKKIIIIK